MGNLSFKCVSGMLPKLRVLLPDGTVVLLDGPVEVVELMMEHPNHMVVHCSGAGSQGMGKRPILTICRPDQELMPGESYVVHPIPPQERKSQQLSLSKSAMEILSGGRPAKHRSDSNADSRGPKLLRQHSWRRVAELLQKSQGKVVDSGAGGELDERLTGESPIDSASGVSVEEEEDEKGVQFRLNMYMGWRPALESIPEAPHV